MERIKIKDLLKSTDLLEQEVTVRGWVRTRRGNKSVSFIALNDGSTINNIQVVADNSLFSADLISLITTGAGIGVTGKLVSSQGKGQSVEIQATSIEVYGTADPNTYPLQKKRALFGIFPRNSPSASENQYFWCCFAHSSSNVLCNPYFLSQQRVLLFTYPYYNLQRRRGSRANVSRKYFRYEPAPSNGGW